MVIEDDTVFKSKGLKKDALTVRMTWIDRGLRFTQNSTDNEPLSSCRRNEPYSFEGIIDCDPFLKNKHMATDWQNYAEHMVEVMNQAPGFDNIAPEGDFIPRPEERPLTKFEARGHRLGHGVWDIKFKRTR